MPGFCFNVGPVPTGRAPHTCVATLSQPAVACRRNGRLLRPEGPLFALRRIRHARARGQRQQLGVSREHLCNPRGQKRGRRGGSASSAATAHAHPGGGGGGARRRHAGGLRPCTRSASPGVGLAVVRSGAFSSAWAYSQGMMFYVGAGTPRVRAPSSRAPVSTTAQGAQLDRCRVHRGCRVFVDRGARRPRDVRRPRAAARWAEGSAFPTYPVPRAIALQKGRYSRTALHRACLQYQAMQKRAPGGARCVHSGAHRRRLARGCCPRALQGRNR